MRLTGKVAIVTGSSRGIGRATAIEFGREGASVVVNYNSAADKAAEVVSQIKGFGSKAIAVKANMGVMKERKAVVDAAIKEFGRIDILVNNAGIHYVIPNLESVTEEEFARTLAVDLGSVMFMSQLVAPYMKKQGNGSIINVSTASIFVSPAESPQYFAAKGGIDTLTRSLASMLSPEIRVNCVAPGCIDTDMFAHHSPESKKFLASTTPLGRLGRAEEVAMTIAFLASDEASFITGTTIRIDGGRTTGTGKGGGHAADLATIKAGIAKY